MKKESELQQRNEMISHLKDQLQEMKAKSNMEGKYIKKCAEVAVAQTQKRCMLSEKELKDEIEVRCFCCCCCPVLFCFVQKIKQQVLWEVHWVCQDLNPEILLGLGGRAQRWN